MNHYYLLLLLSLLSCIAGIEAGTGNELENTRIVGGTPCTTKKYPFMVNVRLSARRDDPDAPADDYNHYCGGSLINNKWVLSAAHCYSEDRNNALEQYLVVAGISVQSQYKKPKYQRSALEKIVTKAYDSETQANDIALLKLKTPLRRTKTVDFTTLPGNNLYPRDLLEINPICTTMGWGTAFATIPYRLEKEPNELYSDQLLCVNLPLIRYSQCKKIFGEINPNVVLTDSQMCTLHRGAQKDACTADSGGPLVCNKIQQGIVSWGIGCALEGHPGVFTRIDKYMDWIKYICKKVKTRKLNVPKKPKKMNITKAPVGQSSILLSNYIPCLIIVFMSLIFQK